jgi:hypothetical protein
LISSLTSCGQRNDSENIVETDSGNQVAETNEIESEETTVETSPTEEEPVVYVDQRTPEEKARLAAEGERMRAASVQKEKERQQYSQPNSSSQRFTLAFICSDLSNTGRNRTLSMTLITEIGQSNGAYNFLITRPPFSELCNTYFKPFADLDLLKQHGQLINSTGEKNLYLININNSSIGVIGEE